MARSICGMEIRPGGSTVHRCFSRLSASLRAVNTAWQGRHTSCRRMAWGGYQSSGFCAGQKGRFILCWTGRRNPCGAIRINSNWRFPIRLKAGRCASAGACAISASSRCSFRLVRIRPFAVRLYRASHGRIAIWSSVSRKRQQSWQSRRNAC